MFRLGLHPDAYERLKTIAGSRMTSGGELIITARRFRTQEANREDARRATGGNDRRSPYRARRKRKPTRPSQGGQGQSASTRRRGAARSSRRAER